MKTILLVEPNKKQAEQYAAKLEEADYKVMTAADGEEALKILETESIDAVIQEIGHLGIGIDGVELLGKIVVKENAMPVFIHTAHKHYKDNFMTWIAEHYIIKGEYSLDNDVIPILKEYFEAEERAKR